MKKTNELKGRYKLDLDLLKTLYKIRSFSHDEGRMTNFLKETLTTMNIPHEEHEGNIFFLDLDDAPVLVAHIDMVNTYPTLTFKKKEPEAKKIWPVSWGNFNKEQIKKAEEEKEKADKILLEQERCKRNTINRFEEKDGMIKAFNYENKQVSLGADDKNGIFAILELLKLGYRFNFIFTTGEEVGCIGINELLRYEEFTTKLESKPYAIIIDRRNGRDIIGFDNEYCIGLDYRIEEFSETLGIKYTCAMGLYSDADEISNHLECVNLSCGYYKAHTSEEFTNLSELKTTILLTARMLEDFKYTSLPVERYKHGATRGLTDCWGYSKDDYAGGWEDTYSEKKSSRTGNLERGNLITASQTNISELKDNEKIKCTRCQTINTVESLKENWGECVMCSSEIIDQDGFLDMDDIEDNNLSFDGGFSNSNTGFYPY